MPLYTISTEAILDTVSYDSNQIRSNIQKVIVHMDTMTALTTYSVLSNKQCRENRVRF